VESIRNPDDFLGVIAVVLGLHDIMLRKQNGKVSSPVETGPMPSLPAILIANKDGWGGEEGNDGRVVVDDTGDEHHLQLRNLGARERTAEGDY
jgi:hypothetical protein